MAWFSFGKLPKTAIKEEEPTEIPPEYYSSIMFKCRNCQKEFSGAKILKGAMEYVAENLVSHGKHPIYTTDPHAFIIYDKCKHQCSEDCWSIGDFIRIITNS
jgi:hypothetical protein